MAKYNNVLLAVDFHPDNEQVIRRADEEVKLHGATLNVIHVVEPVAYAYTDGMTTWGEEMVSLETAIQESARTKMSELCKRLQIKEGHCFFRTGRPADEIHAVAAEQEIDLIIMGTHGQSGLQLLLGSTANSVLHGSHCDVLAVRIREKAA